MMGVPKCGSYGGATDDAIIPHFFCLPKAHLNLLMLWYICCQESEILSVFFEIRFSQLSIFEHNLNGISKPFS